MMLAPGWEPGWELCTLINLPTGVPGVEKREQNRSPKQLSDSLYVLLLL